MVFKALSTKPYTPWPNKAEAPWRVFKATLFDLCAQMGSSPELKKVTVRERLRKTLVVRFSRVTYGWKPIVELVLEEHQEMFWPLLNTNHCSNWRRQKRPETWLTEPSRSWLWSRMLKPGKGQISEEIAARLLPSEGPFFFTQRQSVLLAN